MTPYEFIEHVVHKNIQNVFEQDAIMAKFSNVRWNYEIYIESLKEFYGGNVLEKEDLLIPNLLHRVHDEFYINNHQLRHPFSTLRNYAGKKLLRSDEDPMFKKIFINHSWEPINKNLDNVFWQSVLYWQMQYKTPFYILHSEKNSNDTEYIAQRLHSKFIHWFAHAYICSEFYFKHYNKLDIITDYQSRPIKYPWLCANRLIRKHRTDFLELLNLDSGCYSFLNPDPNGLTYFGPVTARSFDDHTNSSAEIDCFDLNPWNTSFLHVVTETVWQDKIHFTEKVFKPIVLHQPFVVLQAPGSLEYLHSYGFKTFGDWWDESYDTIQDPQERMQAIADIVNWIPSQDLYKMREEMSGVLEHNFRHFYENIPDIVLDELRVNLQNAV